MTKQQHPITPPPELVRQWMERTEYDEHTWFYESYIAEQAANWGYQQGANAELEACIEWLGDAPVVYNDNGDLHPGSYLRDARRPKPPSLKEQALETLRQIPIDPEAGVSSVELDTIRRALEQLND